MRKAAYYTACLVGLACTAVFMFGLLDASMFWFTEIVPLHWARGNPWPAIIPVTIAAFAAAMFVANATETKEAA